MNRLYRKEKVYPQIDKAFRFIDTYNRKTSAALWVHPFSSITHTVFYSGKNCLPQQIKGWLFVEVNRDRGGSLAGHI